MSQWSLPKPDPASPDGAPPRQFVWPPRPSLDLRVPPGAEHPSSDPTSRPSDSPSVATQTSAVNGSVLTQAVAAESPGGSAVLRPSWWSQVEQAWLDTVAPPLLERAAIAGWTPSPPDSYCHRCGETLTRGESPEGPCAACVDAPRPPWSRVVRLGEYRAPLSRWIHDVKFTRWRRLGRDLGRLLGEAVQAELAAASKTTPGFPIGPPAVVPMPMPLLRRIGRGIDHSRAIARGVADVTGGRIVQPLTRELRPSQLSVAPSHRQANIAGAIKPIPAWRRPGIKAGLVILVDDVSTTGATLRAACRALRKCRDDDFDPKNTLIWCALAGKTPAAGSRESVRGGIVP